MSVLTKKASSTRPMNKRVLWLIIAILVLLLFGAYVKQRYLGDAQKFSTLTGEVIAIEGNTFLVRTVALPTDAQPYTAGTTWLWRIHWDENTTFYHRLAEPDPEETEVAKQTREEASAEDLAVGLRVTFSSRRDVSTLFDKDVKEVEASMILLPETR
jgi:hypothetical protein